MECAVRRGERPAFRHRPFEPGLDERGRAGTLARDDPDHQDGQIGRQHGDVRILLESGEAEVQAVSFPARCGTKTGSGCC